MMDKDEPFVYNEVDYKTPKQSPQTWPMDKKRQSRLQHKMSSLLSPVTPKRNYNPKSLLLQCLRDAKSDPLPRRRFPVSCSDEGILMDGVLVTSATKKKASESSTFLSQQKKNTEFTSPISESGHNQETTRSQQSSSAGKGTELANSHCTPKASNPSKLQASAEPFLLTPRQASPFPFQQYPYNPRLPCSPYLYLHQPRPLPYLCQQAPLLPLLPHGSYPYKLDNPEEFPSVFFGGQRQTRNERRRTLLPTVPSSNQPNITTCDPPVRTPLSTTPTANFRTSTTTNANGSSTSVDGLDTVTQIPDLSPLGSKGLETVKQKPDLSTPSDEMQTVTQKPDSSTPSAEVETMKQKPNLPTPSAEVETVTQKPDMSTPSDEVETVTQKPDLSTPSDEVETMMQKPDLSSESNGLETVGPDLSTPSVGEEKVAQKPDLPSPSDGRQTMTIERDWSPSDDGLPTLTQARLDFMDSHNRVFPDNVFGGYKYKKRMPIFKILEVHEEIKKEVLASCMSQCLLSKHP